MYTAKRKVYTAKKVLHKEINTKINKDTLSTKAATNDYSSDYQSINNNISKRQVIPNGQNAKISNNKSKVLQQQFKQRFKQNIQRWNT